MSDVPYDAGDPEHVHDARVIAKAAGSAQDVMLRTAMRDTDFRGWIWTLLTHCHFASTPFSPDPYTTAYLCGEQNIGHRVLADIVHAAPDLYIKMLEERQNGG